MKIVNRIPANMGNFLFGAATLLVGCHEGHPPRKTLGVGLLVAMV